MTLFRIWAFIGAFVLTIAGCSDDGITCDASANRGVIVTVRGAGNPDGGTITVTATDGDYTEELECGAVGDSLECSGVFERAGTYLIEVIADGDVVLTAEVTVLKDECHVITEHVTL